MQKYPDIPETVRGTPGWPSKPVSHPAGERVGLHYHDVEEWLQVLEGDMTFFTAGGTPSRVVKGDAFRILPGEVHSVEIGPAGVTYKMWTTVAESDEAFAHPVSDQLRLLIESNLALPTVENRWDQRNRLALTDENGRDRTFLETFLSEHLTFRTAKGIYVGREQYLNRDAAKVERASSGSVQILHASPETLLLSTAVEMPAPAGVKASFSNIRLFVKEGGAWKCSVWLNFPEPAVS